MTQQHVRKALRAMLLLAFVVLLAAGCAQNTKAVGDSSTSAAVSTEPAATQSTEPSGSSAGDSELLVSAAASLSDALNKLVPLFEREHPDIKVRLNLAASGTLQKQIEQGAPSDLFISAGTKQMKALNDKGLTDSAQTANLLTNELVLVVPADSGLAAVAADALSGPDFAKIAVGQPESVPAGMYAQQFLKSAGLWDKLGNRLVMAKDVRQVLTYVASGNADAGFVYNSDAAGEPKVKIAMKVDPSTHDPIDYPAAVLKGSAHPEQAKLFYDYLFSKSAGDIFVEYGFKLAGQ